MNRNARTVSITEEGATYLEKVRPLIEHLMDASLVLADSTTEPRGCIRVSCTQGFGRKFIVPLISRFLELYPDIEVDLVLEDRHANLIEDRIDVAIRNGRLENKEIIARKLVPMQLLVCGSPAYLEKCGVPHSPEELVNHQCINFRLASTGRPFAWEFEQDGSIYSLTVKGRYTVNDPQAACQAAVAGLGLVQLGSYQLIPLIKAGLLKPVLTDYLSKSDRGHYACYLSRRQLPSRVRAFIDFLISEMKHEDFMLQTR